MPKENLSEIENDPNFIAYQEAKEEGLFDDLAPGTYVAFNNGEHVGTGKNRNELIDELYSQGVDSDIFLQQVNVPERVYHIPTPFLVRESDEDEED